MEGDRNAQVTMVTRVFKEASRRRGLSRTMDTKEEEVLGQCSRAHALTRSSIHLTFPEHFLCRP